LFEWGDELLQLGEGFVTGFKKGGMLVRAPPVEAEQDRSIRIQNLTKVVVSWKRLGLAEQRLVPFEVRRDIAYANDRPHVRFIA
jgi:hypothetical protein